MGLLPCLRRGSDRWWLPRNEETGEVIGRLLIAHGRRTPVDPGTRRQVLRALRKDPPLFIFASLNWPGSHASLADLADWLAEQLCPCFSLGDAFLGAPKSNPELRARWRKLYEFFRTLPIEQWLDEAALWLEVCGPPVAVSWKSQWPQIRTEYLPEENGPQAESDSSSMLQQLARLANQHRCFEQSFEQQLQRDKLEALKQLAYGLSHEINNPLANISTRAQQLQRGETDESRKATLQRIVDQVYRAHEMIADLMFYANPPARSDETCSILSLLQQVADSFGEELNRQAIRLQIASPQGDVELRVDMQMIGEAVRALLRNAIDAIGCQGTIVLSLVPEDDQVVIHVADSGPGLSERARHHAFDPYFSGREAGRGLGLGLCRVYRIARLHDGEITLAGGPAGCVATLRLPRQKT
jgi:signal transduction histidine kinase